ncbi:MAG: alpha/beta fold hydrolase [Roseiflexaceae bacterium]
MSIQDSVQPEESQTADQRPAPFFEQRGPTGILLIHGYSGSPDELRGMGTYLAGAGYTVHGPLLAGHGGAPADMLGVSWEDWLASANAGLRLLRERCHAIFICGFSLGGLLGLHMAAREPVAGLIALAPALRLRGGSLLRATGLLRHVMPWYYPLARANFASPAVRAAVLERAPEANLDDPTVVEQIRREAKVPVGSLYELARLQRQVRSDLALVRLPTLIMQGRNDETVNPRSAIEVAAGIRSADQRLVWFERSGHQLPREAEREAVWATAREWLDAQFAARTAIA